MSLGRYRTHIQQHQFGGIELSLECLQSLDQTIDELFSAIDDSANAESLLEHAPYFGVLWPAGKALAAYVVQNVTRLEGRQILEVGCGLALPSLLLGKLGIEVTASDNHPDVPLFLERNQKLNKINLPLFSAVDWRKSPNSAPSWDRIIGSDILYESYQPQALLEVLGRLLKPGGEVWIADHGRPYLQRFVDEARVGGWRVEERVESGAFLLFLTRA